MSGLVGRCDACGAEFVVRRRHRERPLPCESCGARCDVPVNIDFLPLDVATTRDGWSAEVHGWLLALSLFTCLVPLAAWIWWWACAAIRRARDEGRVVLPALTRLRTTAWILMLIEAAVLTAVWPDILRKLR